MQVWIWGVLLAVLTCLKRSYKLYDTLVVKCNFEIWGVLLAVLICFKRSYKLYDILVVKCNFEIWGV